MIYLELIVYHIALFAALELIIKIKEKRHA